MTKGTVKLFLFLDGVSSRDLRLAIIDSRGRLLRRRRVKGGVRSEKLLSSLAAFLASSRLRPAGIVVAQGGGSFSQTRIVCAVVNAMAYGLHLPVAAVASGRPLRELASRCTRLQWASLLIPDYRSQTLN